MKGYHDIDKRISCFANFKFRTRTVGASMTYKTTCLLLCMALANTAAAQDMWVLSDDHTLIVENSEDSKRLLELRTAQNCEALELRLWAMFPQSSVQGVTSGDAMDLAFLLADKQIASEGRLLEVYQSDAEQSDLVYLRLGFWGWDVSDYLPRFTEQSEFSLHVSENGAVQSSTWPVANLGEGIELLKHHCDAQRLNTLL